MYGIIIKENFAFFSYYENMGGEGCYINLNKAEIFDENGNRITSSDIEISDKIILDYLLILSSLPAKIQCTKVKIVK